MSSGLHVTTMKPFGHFQKQSFPPANQKHTLNTLHSNLPTFRSLFSWSFIHAGFIGRIWQFSEHISYEAAMIKT
jgi:hypothetical protein